MLFSSQIHNYKIFSKRQTQPKNTPLRKIPKKKVFGLSLTLRKNPTCMNFLWNWIITLKLIIDKVVEYPLSYRPNNELFLGHPVNKSFIIFIIILTIFCLVDCGTLVSRLDVSTCSSQLANVARNLRKLDFMVIKVS